MVFQRRTKLGLWQKLRGALWPRRGWARALQYLKHRLIRLSDTPENIALGVAIGVAVSFTPFLGLHLVVAFILSWLLGAHFLATLFGTLMGNPWTLPLFMGVSFQTGKWILGMNGAALPSPLTFSYLVDHWAAFLLPMLVGCLPFALLGGMVAYYLVLDLIRSHRALRLHRLSEIWAKKKRDFLAASEKSSRSGVSIASPIVKTFASAKTASKLGAKASPVASREI